MGSRRQGLLKCTEGHRIKCTLEPVSPQAPVKYSKRLAGGYHCFHSPKQMDLFDPSVPEVLERMNEGGEREGNVSACILAPDWT